MTEEEQAALDAKTKAAEAAETKATEAAKAKTDDGEQKYSQAYVEKLREEAKAERLAKKALQDKIDDDEAEKARAEKRFEDIAKSEQRKREEAERHAASVEQKARLRLIRSELKAAAAAAGLEDLDDIALIDARELAELDDDDAIADGAVKLLAKFKELKPKKFKSTSTETTAVEEKKPAPKSTPGTNPSANPKPKSAREMTADEFAKAWAEA